MKNVGIRFHDGSEVAYYGSANIQAGTDEFILIISPIGVEYQSFKILAQVLAADVKEVFEIDLEATV